MIDFEQLTLFPKDVMIAPLETNIECANGKLEIPEGLHTIPCTHGLHRYPGKFIPNLPRYLIREILNGAEGIVCDPFCGSGTTLVELALEGRSFLGMDFDPLSILLSKAKTTPLDEEQLSRFIKICQSINFGTPVPELFPDVPNLTHWFSEQALVELSAIKANCLGLEEPLRTYALAVFSSIIRRVSNADDQTQKTYVSGTLKKNPPPPSELFPVFAQRAAKGMAEYASRLKGRPAGKIIRGDARSDIGQSRFAHVLTSPPYIDSIDYMYNQMLEYFWLLAELEIGGYDTFRKMRKEPMGFRLFDAEEIKESLRCNLPKTWGDLDQMAEDIRSRSPKEADAVLSFFYDFSVHLDKTREQQKAGGYYLCVVGNSLVRKVQIPTATFICDMFKAKGYELEQKLEYEIRRHYMKFPRRGNSGKIKKDYVLIARLH